MCVSDSLHSWHLPVELTWRKGVDESKESDQSGLGEDKIVWNEEFVTKYVAELDSNEFKERLKQAEEYLERC